MTYEHITEPTVLRVLQGDISEDAICQALHASQECVSQDLLAGEVDPLVLDARLDALNDALFAWNEEGDAAACVEALRTLWC